MDEKYLITPQWCMNMDSWPMYLCEHLNDAERRRGVVLFAFLGFLELFQRSTQNMFLIFFFSNHLTFALISILFKNWNDFRKQFKNKYCFFLRFRTFKDELRRIFPSQTKKLLLLHFFTKMEKILVYTLQGPNSHVLDNPV